jgi:hypothetical protein
MSREGAERSASEGLADLRRRRQEALNAVDAIEAKKREAVLAVQAASVELEQLERRAVAGEQVSQAARQRAEKALVDARQAADQPWGERQRAARLGAGDLLAQASRFAASNLDELLADLGEEGLAATAAINEAAQSILDGFAARSDVERRTFELIAMLRRANPGDVERTRAEAVVREAHRLLEGGGEQAPVVLVDPREPRHAPVAGPAAAA